MKLDRWIEISSAQFEMLEAAQSLAHCIDLGGPDSPQVVERLAAWRAAHAAWRIPLDTAPPNGPASNHE